MITDNQIAKFQEQLKTLGYDCSSVAAQKFLECTNGDFVAAVQKYFDNPSLYDEKDAMADKKVAEDPLLNPHMAQENLSSTAALKKAQ